MKFIVYFLIAAIPFFITACDRSDEVGTLTLNVGGDGLSGDSPVDKKIQEMFEKYEVLFKYKYDEAEYCYNWTEFIDINILPYSPAKEEYVERVINYFEDEIFSIFPEGFIKKHLQPTILLADSLKMEWEYIDNVAGNRYADYHNLWGNVTRNYIVIGHVSADFDFTSRDMKEVLISLFVERMMINNKSWPKPQAFLDVSGESYGSFGGNYWNGEFNDLAYWTSSYPPGGATEYFDWWRLGMLRHGRLIHHGYEHTVLWGMDFSLWAMAKLTTGQDFGDYVAFIISRTAAEKETFFADVASRPTSYGGAAAVAKMRTKMQLVKDYFQTNFGITLTEPN